MSGSQNAPHQSARNSARNSTIPELAACKLTLFAYTNCTLLKRRKKNNNNRVVNTPLSDFLLSIRHSCKQSMMHWCSDYFYFFVDRCGFLVQPCWLGFHARVPFSKDIRNAATTDNVTSSRRWAAFASLAQWINLCMRMRKCQSLNS